MNELGLTCPCGAKFRVAASLKGGLANCPVCKKAMPVSGGPEPLFWALLGGAAALVLGVAAALWAFVGPLAGGIALGAGLLLIGVGVIAS